MPDIQPVMASPTTAHQTMGRLQTITLHLQTSHRLTHMTDIADMVS